jgi:AbrB family looped-hinge helix DNA binding protein
MSFTVTTSGKRGTIVIPAPLRKKFGMEEGSLLIIEALDEGLLIKPAMALPIETYSPERKAEFLLTNAISQEEYDEACGTVKAMKLNPGKIKHSSPFK